MSMQPKVFISGPMRGIKNNNEELFNLVEQLWKDKGYNVFNPAWMKFSPGWERELIWKIDLEALAQCDIIVQLPGWEKSDGCAVEYAYYLQHSDKLQLFKYGDKIPDLNELGEMI